MSAKYRQPLDMQFCRYTNLTATYYNTANKSARLMPRQVYMQKFRQRRGCTVVAALSVECVCDIFITPDLVIDSFARSPWQFPSHISLRIYNTKSGFKPIFTCMCLFLWYYPTDSLQNTQVVEFERPKQNTADKMYIV